ncbi:ribosome 60S biogenesis N-terminal-domain-containing protein [Truncatella angustata]|uniref:Ribosome 60S biogenesis N-terminal-domain-containing protein n=1 Tax=Truncatella angustata TaxID=152316 RepID=A0A9P8UWF5_9PEZI|nr:ribosome 60S biogenesis N-terminal-domain-containing protein [Truncatella angustata]KAH6659467.1 ribosome 60S biogenesis N-terminal-domain-containing protein [Truncatella angustata]
MKRKEAPDLGDTTKPPKRKRNIVVEAPTSEEVHSSRQLRQLLTFEQDLRKARHGLQSFKDLLDGVLNEHGTKDPYKLEIVTQYLELTKPRDVQDEPPVYLSDIMEMWSMASQMANENVMSAVAVVLALLLKLIASDVDLVEYGLGIGRTLLQKRQQELLAKNLSADKGKDFIISPTLRLIREVVCMDGGALAVSAFRARNYTYKSLARNMGLRFLGEGIEDLKRPSVRTNAVRVLLASLKFLHAEAKRDLLSQRDVVAALMRGIKEDPPSLIFEILNTLKTSVVLDQKLSKEAKIRILNAQSLIRIASLYTYHHSQISDDNEQSVEEAAHQFLLAACTTASSGILRTQNGFYPEGVDANIAATSESNDDDNGLASIPWMDKFSEEVPVRNLLLSEFILTLKPWSSLKQNELLVAIFKACPELVANYFVNKRTFNFDPTLSATWIGYSTLLFNTIRLDIPPFLGHSKRFARIPPPTATALCNILPLPLDLKAITKCLNHKSKLISFFAIRLLVIALEKLADVLEIYKKAAKASDNLWHDAARRLVDEFCKRVPSLKDVVTAYKGLSDDDLLQRDAASRLLVLYHEAIPQIALAAKYDFSPMLSAAIKRFEDGAVEEQAPMRLLELENLFTTAKYSPGMKWFAKSKDSPVSPFVTLLKLYVENTKGLTAATVTKVLRFVAEEHELISRDSPKSGLQPLLSALRGCDGLQKEIWLFLDNCAERCARSPIKYLEMIYELPAVNSDPADDGADEVLSPLITVIAEQLPFFVKPTTEKVLLTRMAQLLSSYLAQLQAAGVRKSLLQAVLTKLALAFGDSKARKHLLIPEQTVSPEPMDIDGASPQGNSDSLNDDNTQISQEQLEETLSVPITVSKDNSALVKWATKSAEELVEEGYAASVVWLLSSEHRSIRKEALTSIVKIAAKVKESAYEENAQVWLLLSELIETVRQNRDATVPNTILAFVCRALDIIRNPTHSLYPKINTFLTRGPSWDLDKLPLVQDIVQEQPTEDGAYYTEISWLLSYLLDSIRTAEDVGLLHKRKVFERVFALYCNPYMGPNLRSQILRILYRTSTMSGGSDTLLTRFGAASWLELQKATSSSDNGIYRALISRLWNTCDQKRIATWSRDSIQALMENP